MTEDDSNMLTTSFLDVITCGLGSILLLFFLMVAIKGEMRFDGGETAERVSAASEDAPVIILMTGQNGQPLWAKEMIQPWQEPFDLSGENCGKTFAPDHAILYLRKPPPSDWSIKVGPIAPDARLNVQVISGGRRIVEEHDREMKSLPWKQGDFLPLWPPPRAANP